MNGSERDLKSLTGRSELVLYSAEIMEPAMAEALDAIKKAEYILVFVIEKMT